MMLSPWLHPRREIYTWTPSDAMSIRFARVPGGTLHYIFLIAALLTPRPPARMVLNEPETSLHPGLLAPLARLVVQASGRSQIIVVTHSMSLITALAEAGCHSRGGAELSRRAGVLCGLLHQEQKPQRG